MNVARLAGLPESVLAAATLRSEAMEHKKRGRGLTPAMRDAAKAVWAMSDGHGQGGDGAATFATTAAIVRAAVVACMS